MSILSRRDLLRTSLAGAGLYLTGCSQPSSPSAPSAKSSSSTTTDVAAPLREDALAGGRKLGNVDFMEPDVPLDLPVGDELDGTLNTDLSVLDAQSLVVDNERFFVRTRAPSRLTVDETWAIRVHGLLDEPKNYRLGELAPMVSAMGPHLLECSGNSKEGRFGLLSAAEWDGIPLAELLERAQPQAAGKRVLISGFDEHTQPSRHSTPGASWVFTFDEIEKQGAFLAVKMNGQELSPDHGAPVRLVMPGWYGCTCIKWVNEIELVDDDIDATTQMLEFAERTHQRGEPKKARDFAPATIHLAAMPVRVERWEVGGASVYRVVGVVWGGSTPIDTLKIRFNPQEEFQTIHLKSATLPTTWSLWSHVWKPAQPGTYQIHLQAADQAITTQRLDAGYYDRSVQIAKV